MQVNLKFLNNLKLQRKLFLIPALMAIPLAYLIFTYYNEKSNDIQFSSKEQLGVDYLQPLKNVHHELLRYRDLTFIALRGNGSLQAQRMEAAGAVDKQLAATEAIDDSMAAKEGSSYGALFESTSRLKAIEQKWNAMKSRSGSAQESFSETTQLLAEVNDLIRHVGDKSNLILDPDLDTYYLMDLVITQFPALNERVSQSRALAGGALAGKSITPDERAQINALQRQVEANLASFNDSFNRAMEANAQLRENFSGKPEVIIRDLRDFNSTINSQLSGSELNADSTQLFSRGAQLLEQLHQLNESSMQNLSKYVLVRVNKKSGERSTALFITILGFLLAVSAAYLVSNTITGQIDEISSLIGEIEKGNFNQRISVQSSDELGRTAQAFNSMLDNTKGLMQSRDERDQIQNAIMRLLDQVANVADGDLTAEAQVTEDMTGAIADAFNFMIVNLRDLIGKVKDVSYQFNASTSETASFTERLAQGSQEQSERISQTSVALTEMSAQIVRVSQTADSSAQVAEASLSTARKGSEAVSNTVEGMTRIQEQVQETARRIRQLGERSQEIEEIVRLIEEIADRTGVLALNASIQAAAAGEAGYGFTVVASEVEQLAGRSAEATKRISSLIRAIQSGTNEAIASMEEVKREVISGARVAHSAGESLREIEAVSNQLAQLVRSISHATQQQARGSEALSMTMSQIAQLTNQTTTGVMQSALTVKNLAILADDLRASVASFKVADNDEEKMVMSGALASDAQMRAVIRNTAAAAARH